MCLIFALLGEWFESNDNRTNCHCTALLQYIEETVWLGWEVPCLDYAGAVKALYSLVIIKPCRETTQLSYTQTVF